MTVMTTERRDDPRRYALAIREIHDQIDPQEGWRVEIVEGRLVVTPTPMPAHAYLVEIVRTAVEAVLAPEFGVYENIELEEPDTDRYIPDLGVWLRKALRDATGRPQPEFCGLVVEVTSPGQSKSKYAKAGGYARCGIPVYLLVDQVKSMSVVLTEPEGDRYRTRHEVPFGKPVTLPLENPVTIETSEF